MRIVGIDPGPEISGLVLYCTRHRRVLAAHPRLPTVDALALVRAGRYPVGSGTEFYSGLVLETLSPRGMALGRATFQTIEWVGRLREAGEGRIAHMRRCGLAGLWVQTVERDTIKRELLGRSNVAGADAHIRQYLLDRVGPKGTKAAPGPAYGVSGHAWAALAAVICAVRERAEELLP